MLYRQFIRLAAITVLILSVNSSALYAQRSRGMMLYSDENVANGEISGKIVCETGALDGVHVALIHQGMTVIDVVTSTDGVYTFKGLSAGSYDITCTKAGYRKRVINEVPVVEEHLTSSSFKMFLVENWQDERSPSINIFEHLKDHKIEKLRQ